MKIWASASEEGWLLPKGSDSLDGIQTLELKSSAEPGAEEASFNQVVALSQMGLILPANAKKNAIYVVHLDYGPNPASTRLDYISEFTVTMPILSLTGTSDVVHGQSVAQVYCVQTQAIQQYTLELCQCLQAWVFFLGGGEWEVTLLIKETETKCECGFRKDNGRGRDAVWWEVSNL
ncbi:hypothetical protein OIU84_026718 [Salix udensis]|uniref:Uncharacterized protein n=1 Tax=Salix udensis TaxID=889485 RepID=A0AAD6KMD1_9ROSI|nr:hypothetical protein OIU84_026718 [Salix udensis]